MYVCMNAHLELYLSFHIIARFVVYIKPRKIMCVYACMHVLKETSKNDVYVCMHVPMQISKNDTCACMHACMHVLKETSKNVKKAVL